MGRQRTREYLETIVDLILPALPESVRERLIRQARARVGGKRSPRKKRSLTTIEELLLTTIIASPPKDKTEEIVEFLSQLEEEVESELIAEAREALERDLPRSIFEKLPAEIVWIPDFVELTGGAVYAKGREPHDIDIIVKLQGTTSKPHLRLDAAMFLKIKRALEDAFGSEIDSDSLRFAAEAEGDHLVLRTKAVSLLPLIEDVIRQAVDIPVEVTVTPYGANWPHIPLYDLVFRKKKELVLQDIEEPGFEKLRKEVDPKLLVEAERSKREDKVSPFRFIKTMKPIRAAERGERQTEEKFLELVSKYLPVFVSPKRDGASHVFLKDGDRVKIVSEDGSDNTKRLPRLAERLRRIGANKVTLVGEIELWVNGQHYPREAAKAAVTKGEDENLVVSFHDLLLLDDRDLHRSPMRERDALIAKLKFDEATFGRPKRDTIFNRIPRVLVRTRSELASALRKLKDVPGSEGVVADRVEGKYSLTGAPKEFARFKWHKNAAANVIALKRIRTAGGAWMYDYGLRFNVRAFKPKETVELAEKEYLLVGRTFARELRFEPGEILEVEAETINQIVDYDKGTLQITFWAPNLIRKSEARVPDTVTEVTARALKEGILQGKEIRVGETHYIPDEKVRVIKFIKEGYDPRKVRDEVLLDDWRLVAAKYANMKAGKKSEFATIEELVAFAAKILEELYRRGKVTFKP